MSNKKKFKNVFFSRKAFAFSFLVFFIAIVMFTFLNLGMFKDEFTKDSIFVESRVNYLSQEFFYFKNIYLENVVSYSFYNTMNSLAIYSKANGNPINQNYTKLNELVYEGMINGSFEGISQPNLIGSSDGQNKTLNYFLDEYKSSFEKNYKSNLSLEILNINVYEDKPYYLKIQLLINWSVKPYDNVSEWNLVEDVFFSVPVFDLPIPDFLYHEGKNLPSKSVEFNLADQDWSLSNFQKTINESYSSVFFEKEHKYSIGNSYLKRFLNISQGSYDGVIGFWSFDYDEDENGVYDSSLYNGLSSKFANSKGIYDFENDSVIGVNILDKTSYNNSGVLIGGVNCNVLGVNGKGCFFDGTDGYISINDFSNIEKEISVFAWVYLNDSSASEYQRIVCAYGEYFCYWINYDTNKVSVRLNNTDKLGSFAQITFNEVNITKNQWQHIGFTYDGNYTFLYVNGIRYISYLGDAGSDYYSGDLNGGVGNLYIGNSPSLPRFFNGIIDEVGIYSRVLQRDEIAKLYHEKKVYDTDYQDSFHGKGVLFDGVDDYIVINVSDDLKDFAGNDFAIEMWFKPYNITKFNLFTFSSQVTMGYILGQGIYFRDNKGNPILPFEFDFEESKYYHLVLIRDNLNDINSVYVNGNLIKNQFLGGNWSPSLNGRNFSLGSIYGGPTGTNFNGIIDEVKIYNRTLSKEEIVNNYLGYDSFGKGCCNYLLLMNPNEFGYNTLSDKVNISYSTKLFYDYHKRGKLYNISLFNLTNVTSNDVGEDYYNFLFDDCIQHAFGVSDYQTNDSKIKLDLYKLEGIDNATCSNLVKLGIY